MCHHLIYGGTGGIGSAIARSLYKNGHTVHLAARNEDKLKALSEELNCQYTAGDVTEEGFFEKASKEASTDGAFNGCVYAIGRMTLKPMAQLTAEDVLQDFMMNTVYALKAAQAAAPYLARVKTGPSSILLFSSAAVAQGLPAHTSFAMSKGAIEGMVKSLAAELSPRTRVNAIAPSITVTPTTMPLLADENLRAALGAAHAMNRMGVPEDLGELANVILTVAGNFMTGQVFHVDGGRSTVRARG